MGDDLTQGLVDAFRERLRHEKCEGPRVVICPPASAIHGKPNEKKRKKRRRRKQLLGEHVPKRGRRPRRRYDRITYLRAEPASCTYQECGSTALEGVGNERVCSRCGHRYRW